MREERRRHSWTMKRKYSCCLGASEHFAPLQALGHQAHGGDGSAQFVGDAGDEVALQLVEAQLALEGAPGGKHADQGREGRRGHQPGQQQRVAAVRGEQQRRVGHVKLQDEARAAGQVFPVNLRAAGALRSLPVGKTAVGFGQKHGRGVGAPGRGPAFRQSQRLPLQPCGEAEVVRAASPRNSPAPAPARARRPIWAGTALLSRRHSWSRPCLRWLRCTVRLCSGFKIHSQRVWSCSIQRLVVVMPRSLPVWRTASAMSCSFRRAFQSVRQAPTPACSVVLVPASLLQLVQQSRDQRAGRAEHLAGNRFPQLLGWPGSAGVAQRLPKRQVRQRQARLGKRLAVFLGEVAAPRRTASRRRQCRQPRAQADERGVHLRFRLRAGFLELGDALLDFLDARPRTLPPPSAPPRPRVAPGKGL